MITTVIHSAGLADEACVAAIFAEYCDSLAVLARDTSADIRAYLAPPGGLWLAHVGAGVAGCIALRPFSDKIGEIKRLYVRPAYRGQKIADALVDALEAGARERGFRELYLDTHDGLQAAQRLYERRGFTRREKYNDNPQATIFMQRQL